MVNFVVQNKTALVRVFQLFYLILVLFIGYTGYVVFNRDPNFPFVAEMALLSGRTSIVLFCITLLPGICRRFGITNPVVSAIQVLRRYFGISVYLTAAVHGFTLGTFPRMSGMVPPTTPLLLFEIMGFTALNLLFVLFLTSNNFSVAKLGKWWARIHRVVYVIAWLIFAHVALQNVYSIWAILIGLVAVLEILSYIFNSLQKTENSVTT